MRTSSCARSIRLIVVAALLATASAAAAQGTPSRLRFAITFPAERSSTPLDGRLLLMISADTAGEPRQQVSGTVATAQVFGVDVDGWKPGETRYVDATAFGYPAAVPEPAQGRSVSRAGDDQSLRNVQAQRRPHGQAAA